MRLSYYSLESSSFARTLLVMVYLFSACPAMAQTPVDLFGLSGSAIHRFERSPERAKRDLNLRELRAIRAQTESVLNMSRNLRSTAWTADASKRAEQLQSVDVAADSNRFAVADRAFIAAFKEHKRLTPIEDSDSLARYPTPDFLPTFDTSIELVDRGGESWRITAGGTALYDVPFKGARNTHITIIGNLGGLVNSDLSAARESLTAVVDAVRSSKSGLNIGLTGWYLLNSAQVNASWVPYLSIVGKLNRVPVLDAGDDIDFAQGLLSVGVSSGHGFAGAGRPHPIGLSMGATYSSFSRSQHKQVFGVDRDHRWDGHATLILPIREGAAVVVENNFSRGSGSAWRSGFALVRGSSK